MEETINVDEKQAGAGRAGMTGSACRDYYATIKRAQEATKGFPIPHQVFQHRNGEIDFLPIDFYEETEINEVPLCLVYTKFSDFPRNAERPASPAPRATYMTGSVKGRRVHAVVRRGVPMRKTSF